MMLKLSLHSHSQLSHLFYG